jgi:Rrf2 family protein
VTVTDPASPASPAAVFGFPPFRLSARTSYAIRALTELAASRDGPLTAQSIAHAQGIPRSYVANVLTELRRLGLVRSHRGGPGAGYELARPAARITFAEVIGALERDLSRPSLDEVSYPGAAEPLRDVWLAARATLSAVLESVTLADVAGGTLPEAVRIAAAQQHPPAG